MMGSSVALRIENLSKLYRLGEVGTGSLVQDLNRWLHKVRGKEDPYSIVGVTNDREQSGGDYVWALKDISFDVHQGDVIGIVGKNGAGKSTLLKLLSRITSPTTGSISIRGRIASLLEVGTGFHPELTARENVFLNGAILGMRKSEIKTNFDEIIDFAGCAKYVDTPVKRFSSGMRVRLGFAVAAFLNPEILVVDEVLAVGDAEFQKKAIGKMKDVSQNMGRTVLFVSHNMSSVKSLCTKGVLLEHGQMQFMGGIDETINHYLAPSVLLSKQKRVLEKQFYIQNAILVKEQQEIEIGYTGDRLQLALEYSNSSDLRQVHVSVVLKNKYDVRLTTASTSLLRTDVRVKHGQGRIYCEFLELPINKGSYVFDVHVYKYSNGRELIDSYPEAIEFRIEHGGDPYNSGMEQGEGIDVFSSKFRITGDEV